MDRKRFVLASLVPSNGAPLTPVQVQKLFFLLDRNIPQIIGGPHFGFVPYDYGPFDPSVYAELESAAAAGLVIVENPGTRQRRFSLTSEGLRIGQQAFAELPVPTQKYISDVVNWVRSLSFRQLVSAIYNSYPEMKTNSVFAGDRQ